MEIEDYKQETQAFHQKSEKIVDIYKALIEEAEVQVKDVDKLKYDYEKHITKRAYQARYDAIMAEKLVRFLEEHLRSQDTLVDRLRLNNTTLRVQKKKLLSQQRQKEEMGEVLHEVDFEQLKIENSQFLEIIDGKNKELLRLKLTAGHILQALNSLRRRLAQLQQDSDLLKSEIKSRDDMVERTVGETTKVLREKETVEGQFNRLKRLMADYSVPPALDYVESVREVRHLKRREKIEGRKVEIAKINLNRYRRMWKQINQTNALLPY